MRLWDRLLTFRWHYLLYAVIRLRSVKCRFTNINVKLAATALKSLCCLPVTRRPSVRNVSVGMSKNSCRPAVCDPRVLPPVPADLMPRLANPAAEGFKLAPQFEVKLVLEPVYTFRPKGPLAVRKNVTRSNPNDKSLGSKSIKSSIFSGPSSNHTKHLLSLENA